MSEPGRRSVTFADARVHSIKEWYFAKRVPPGADFAIRRSGPHLVVGGDGATVVPCGLLLSRHRGESVFRALAWEQLHAQPVANTRLRRCKKWRRYWRERENGGERARTAANWFRAKGPSRRRNLLVRVDVE